jgi:predicted  nucleic acid-binding Zn-ribbon protein
VREEYRALEEKVLRVQKNIDDLKKKLDSEWTYEIYGTISKDEMLNTYNQTMKK